MCPARTYHAANCLPGATPIPNPSETPGAIAADPPEPDEIAAIGSRLGIDLPPECVAGVRHHSRLLDQHWTSLRGVGIPRP